MPTSLLPQFPLNVSSTAWTGFFLGLKVGRHRHILETCSSCCTNSERAHYSDWNRQVSAGFCGTACDDVKKRCEFLQRRADDTHTHSLFSREIFSQSLAVGSRSDSVLAHRRAALFSSS